MPVPPSPDSARREYPRAVRPASGPTPGPPAAPNAATSAPAGGSAYPPAYRPQTFAPEPAVRGTLNAAYAPPPNTSGPIEQVWSPGQRTSNRLVFNVVIYVIGGIALLVALGYIAVATGLSSTSVAFVHARVPLTHVLNGVRWLARWEPET